MNQWNFVIAAYAVVIVVSIGLTLWSFVAMRRAERRVDDLRRNICRNI